MGWFILMNIFSVLLSLVRTRNLSDQEKDLEILILRKQLTILQRQLDKPIRPNRTDKLILSVLTKRFKILSNQSTAQLQSVILIFQPSTVMRWHRQLVRLK